LWRIGVVGLAILHEIFLRVGQRKTPEARGCGGSKMRADAASGLDRYRADLTLGGACLHAATEAAAEKQRRRRL